MQLHTRVVLGLSIATLAISDPACAGHRIGGKSIADVFKDPGLAQMTDASCRGDAKTVARLAAAGVNPSGTGLDGVPPLFWAIHCENLVGMEALLKAGANPNYFIRGGRFSLVGQAATFRNPGMLRLMLKYGGDPNGRAWGNDPNDIGVLESWPIRHAIDLANDNGDWTNYYLLLNGGLNINQSDSTGQTVTIRLTSGDHWDKIEELLERGYNYDLARLARYLEFLGPGGRKEKDAKERVAKRLEAMGYKVPDWLGRKK